MTVQLREEGCIGTHTIGTMTIPTFDRVLICNLNIRESVKSPGSKSTENRCLTERPALLAGATRHGTDLNASVRAAQDKIDTGDGVRAI